MELTFSLIFQTIQQCKISKKKLSPRAEQSRRGGLRAYVRVILTTAQVLI